MEIKKRLRSAIAGGVFCAIAGSILGGVVVALVRAFQGNTNEIAENLAVLPMAVIFGAIPAAPFGFIVGSIGSWWLVGRLDRGVSGRRLYFESAGIGALLGTTFPLVLAAFGWGPFDNLVSDMPISITVGMICGAVLVPITRKRLAAPAKVAVANEM